MSGHGEHRELFRAYASLGRLPANLSGLVNRSVTAFSAPPDHELFREDGPCVSLPLLTRGVVRVSRHSPDGREILLYRVRPGDFCVLSIGCLLGHSGYPASGHSETETAGFLLPAPTFRELLYRDDRFRGALFGFFTRRLAETMALVESVRFERLDARLARALLERGPVLLTTHKSLADELGSAREAVSRLLKTFESAGLVRLGRGRVEVLDPPALRRTAAGSDPGDPAAV